MQALIRKLNYIAEDCGFTYEEMKEENSEPPLSKEEQTPFNTRRRDLKILLKDIEECIQNRAEEESKSDCDRVELVKMSTEIRKKMKDAIALAEEMKVIHDKDVTKNRKKFKDPKILERLGIEESSLGVIKQHIEKLQAMEKERNGAGDIKGGIPQISGLEKYKVDEIPEIDDDDRFAQLRKNDEEIDKQLDIVANGVKELKDVAIDIGQKVDVQTDKLEVLDGKVEHINERYDQTNEKLKGVLDKVRGPDKMLMTIMMVFVLLGVGSIIAMIFI
ncbi:t-SNARE coiled-coil-like proteiny domain-containing protein [Entamoeba marina]